jgi:hypothetical protein
VTTDPSHIAAVLRASGEGMAAEIVEALAASQASGVATGEVPELEGPEAFDRPQPTIPALSSQGAAAEANLQRQGAALLAALHEATAGRFKS